MEKKCYCEKCKHFEIKIDKMQVATYFCKLDNNVTCFFLSCENFKNRINNGK